MSNYTQTNDFGAKDSLPTGDPEKIIRGADFETEFDNIATAIATKADAAGTTLTGTTSFQTLSDGIISVAAFVDEDDMSSNSATLLPTQQSVKAYVDSQVTAQDLDFQGDSGGALSIDLDSETLTVAGGTGIETAGSANTLTVNIDSTVATLTGTQTLTNKTLTAPNISGNLTTDGTIDGRDVATDGTKLDGIEASATADQTDAEIRSAVEAATDSNVFTDADHTKLNGIEASADVTDATNVEAAGALMDSEVTNLAQVKAFDTSDYATAAQGTTADSALPKTGGAMTGAITTNSTFDGRDVATDGTKLDTVETNADVTDTANVTAAGAVMDSELTDITAVKALNQGVATTDSPTFAGATISSISYPTTDGQDGQVLTTDGNGALTFADAGGGGFDPDVDNPAIGNGSAVGTNSSAYGHDATASGTSSIAVGFGANVGSSTTSSIAIGTDTDATADSAVALGVLAQATATYGVAIGQQAAASNTGGVSIGYASSATTDAVAVGRNADATTDAISIGANSDATASRSIAVGHEADALAQESIAIGDNANTASAANFGIAIGDSANANAANTLHINASGSSTNAPAVAGNMVIETDDARLEYKSSKWELFGGNVEIDNGNLVLGTSGNGIDFSTTSDTSGMTSELLDDYEEGTFDPYFFGTTTAGVFTYSQQNGYYTKIGRAVHFLIQLTASAKTTAPAGSLRIGGLPFTAGAMNGGTAAIGYVANFANDNHPDGANITSSSTNILLRIRNDVTLVAESTPGAAQPILTAVVAGSVGNSPQIKLSGVYFV